MRFVGVSLDCADPAELADFYFQLLSGRVLWSRPTSFGVQVPGLLLIPQRVANYRPPTWPEASIVHLDLTAGEHLEEPVQRAVALCQGTRGTARRRTRSLPGGGHQICPVAATRTASLN